jgi:Leucine-rich repeat (LRR) protein
LTHLPDFIKDFEYLTELNLDKNKFAVFPIQICSMKRLEKLIVSRNEFSSIPECIQYASNLNYLDLSDTPVTSFPEAFVLMTNLKTLSLHGLAYPPSFHIRWKERLPWMRIEFDAPCNCME